MTADAELNEVVDARFPIRLADGRDFRAVVYRHRTRKGQRRIAVTDGGKCRFDSGMCEDRDTAFRKLDQWLSDL